eukprot:1157924-Pelagomonas_calceolata.AAC.9
MKLLHEIGFMVSAGTRSTWQLMVPMPMFEYIAKRLQSPAWNTPKPHACTGFDIWPHRAVFSCTCCAAAATLTHSSPFPPSPPQSCYTTHRPLH